MGSLYIGTSGWNYKHWFGRFYPPKLPAAQLLRFYARYFDTVEINNSFYRLPKLRTFSDWRNSVPDNFVFAVKASRFITHMKKLKAPITSSHKLFNRIRRLQNKLGPTLFQLPPGWNVDKGRLALFLKRLPPTLQCAIEFRNSTWLEEEVFEMLRQHNVAFCIQDFRGEPSPRIITADFVYVRMHGPTAASYAGSYSTEQLRAWSEQLSGWHRQLKHVYIYFNNDFEGNAVRNALELKSLLA